MLKVILQIALNMFKVKTFEYTDEKYKDNDTYGFIAQQLQKHLPKAFNIVKETKPKKRRRRPILKY